MDVKDCFSQSRLNLPCCGMLLLLFYIPFGLIILVARVCLLLISTIILSTSSYLLPAESALKSCFVELLSKILGFHINVKNDKLLGNNSILLANQTSNIDHLLLSFLLGFHQVVTNNSAVMFADTSVLSVNSDKREKELDDLVKTQKAVVHFPEGVVTSARVVFPFCDWPFHSKLKIQPVAVQATRFPFDISPSVLGSGVFGDLLWSFFCPFTVYDVTIMEPMSRPEGHSVAEYRELVRSALGKKLKNVLVEFTVDDIRTFASKHTSPQQRREQQAKRDEFESKVKRVREVLPYVPRNLVVQDLKKTESIDATVCNFVEGNIKFEPLTPEQIEREKREAEASKRKLAAAKKKKNFESSLPIERQMTLEEKKAAFIEKARQDYIKKHKLVL